MNDSLEGENPHPPAWRLVAPDWAELDTIWRSPLPFLLWPVCEKPLLAWWLDEAVRQGVSSVTIEAVDRPHCLRKWLDARDLWSRSIEVDSTPRTPENTVRIVADTLPGSSPCPPLQSPRDLLQHWFSLQVASLEKRSSGMVHLDAEYRPGIWFAPGAKAARDTVFSPPCWIGSTARIGPNCRIGPNAFVGPGAFLDEDVEVSNAVVLGETYVGSHTTLHNVAVQGGLLMDFERGAAVEVTDDFVLSNLHKTDSVPFLTRAAAALLAPILEVFAKLAAKGAPPERQTIRLGRDKDVPLITYPQGPLLLRRAAWFRLVASGELGLVGILPRSPENWESLPPDAHAALAAVRPGVFALSDLYGCHSADRPDEWLHAAFQAGAPEKAGQKMAEKSLAKIAFTTPPFP